MDQHEASRCVFLRRLLAPMGPTTEDEEALNIGAHHLFSIVTTEPNSVVCPFTEKAMQVMLMTPEDVER